MNPLISPRALRTKLPLSPRAQAFILESREKAINIFNKKEKKPLIIMGPCSIHDCKATIEYAEKFKALSEELKDQCYMIMRLYLEKPRSQLGWKGIVYDPFLDGSYNIEEGLMLSRELLIRMAELKVPCAMEVLEPLFVPYFHDLICWGFIGARTCVSQIHRQIASSLPFPVGIKNPLDGNLEGAIQTILSARAVHHFPSIDEHGHIAVVESQGNPYTHIVLRGSYLSPNFCKQSVEHTRKALTSAGIKPRILIDCSHDNSQKIPRNQITSFQSVMKQIHDNDEDLMGVMLESFLEEGHQLHGESISDLKYGVSITDPCLDWKKSEEMIKEILLAKAHHQL